jgi:putative CocE/NonD family hydrolase
LGAVAGLDEDKREIAKKQLNHAAAHLQESMSYLPHRNAPGLERELVSYYQEWLDHPEYDEYWKSIDATQKASSVTAPTLDITGWQDLFSRGHMDMYNALKKNGKDIPKNEQRLLIGPWAHESYMGYANDRVGDKVFGPIASSAAGFVGPFIFKWFDAWLKDETEKLKELPLVRYFDIGSREWTNAETWPPKGKDVNYYLHSSGQANTRFGNGSLLLDSPEIQCPDSYLYDPLDPVPTKGGRIQMPEVQEAGVKDQSVVEEREDVLVYTTKHLDKAVKIAGPVEAKLFISSSAVDTDFTAKLVDVEPDGYCGNVTEGIIRARYRESMEKEVLMEPGEVYEISVDLWHVAHTFKPGHKIRLEISSSSFPRWDRNSNTEIQAAEAAAEDMQIATNVIYHEPKMESYISFHVTE